MKKIILIFISFIFLITISFFIWKNQNQFYPNKVSDHGFLSIKDGQLVDQNGEIMMLRGVSSHSIYWFCDFYQYDYLKELVDSWKINVFRVTMYTNPDDDGYVKYPEIKEKLYELVDDCIKLDIYVVIDWHILNDNNPTIYQKEAEEFFDEVSKKYQDVPNVLYEICNEPNGDDVTWDEDIYPYAESVISVIRNNSKQSIILVGTANWSKDLESVRYHRLEDPNVMYVVHTYPEGGISIIEPGLQNAYREKIPVIVTECSATDPTGDGILYKDFFREWIQGLEENHVSWIVWQFSDNYESSSLLLSKDIKDYPNKNFHNEYALSEFGELVKELMIQYNKK